MGSAICVDNSVVGQCTEELPADPFTILEASISDDSLSLVIQYGGGCADHIFTGCFGSFMESFPVQVNLEIGHDANNDMCMALPVAFEEFDLSELKTAYQEGYQTENGSIIIHVAGWTESLTYTF